MFDRNRSLENSWAKENFIQLAAIRELYDLIDDITHRLRTNFNITLNSGKMKWNNPTEKAMACKVSWLKNSIILLKFPKTHKKLFV